LSGGGLATPSVFFVIDGVQYALLVEKVAKNICTNFKKFNLFSPE